MEIRALPLKLGMTDDGRLMVTCQAGNPCEMWPLTSHDPGENYYTLLDAVRHAKTAIH